MSKAKDRDAAAGRNRLQVDERRSQLIALGLEMFSDATYEEMSIGEIAKAAGISKGLLYHYFPSKRAFFAAAVREAARQLLAETDGPTPDHPDPDELFRRINRYLAFVEKRPASYVFLLRGQRGDDEVRAIVDDTRQAFVARILSGIGASLGGEPASDRLRIAVRGWVGFVEAASLEWLERGRTVAREEMARMLAAVCVTTIEMAVGRSLVRPGQSRAHARRG